jgi:hypothetical protein
VARPSGIDGPGAGRPSLPERAAAHEPKRKRGPNLRTALACASGSCVPTCGGTMSLLGGRGRAFETPAAPPHLEAIRYCFPLFSGT